MKNNFILLFEHLGRYFLLLKQLAQFPQNYTFHLKELVKQLDELGTKTLPIILMVSVFAGAVTSAQLASQIKNIPLAPYTLVGSASRTTIFLSLAATFNGIVLAGVIGSKITSELGNMRLSEQIDALEIMGINPKLYLIQPKVIAALVCIPFLTVISFFICYLGARYGAIFSGNVSAEQFDEGFMYNIKLEYARIGIIKGIVFSFLITTVSAYFGYYVKGGAVEIGQAATRSVIACCTLILLFDYILTVILL